MRERTSGQSKKKNIKGDQDTHAVLRRTSASSPTEASDAAVTSFTRRRPHWLARQPFQLNSAIDYPPMRLPSAALPQDEARQKINSSSKSGGSGGNNTRQQQRPKQQRPQRGPPPSHGGA